MAMSKSQKKLRHKLKNNTVFDPRMKRGAWVNGNGITKKDTNLVQEIRKSDKKHRGRNGYGLDEDYAH